MTAEELLNLTSILQGLVQKVPDRVMKQYLKKIEHLGLRKYQTEVPAIITRLYPWQGPPLKAEVFYSIRHAIQRVPLLNEQ